MGVRVGARAWASAGIAAVAVMGLAMPASAGTSGVTARETVCYGGTTICNNTYGSGNGISEVIASRNLNTTAEFGFFELFGPGSYKQTGPTNRESDHTFKVNASFPRGSLICVSFWNRNANGSFTKVGGKNGNACTSTPIG
ncbi:hypothetical protein [Amycolatopsis sp. cmx-11-12]|uniref:hypothetical protein n=1 Tax=Amycolatopsis sp. cmx-11-12 TaxID=2785795 RepID=UPI0039182877